MGTRKSSPKFLVVSCMLICFGLVVFITLRYLIPLANGTLAEPKQEREYSKKDVDKKVLELLNKEDKRYAYKQLSKNEKEAYKALQWGILAFAEKIDIREQKLTVEDLQRVYSALRNDYPEIFWTYNNCNIYNTGKYITICEPYYIYNKESVLNMVDSVNSVKTALINNTTGLSDYEKCMYFFNYIIDYTDYDTESYDKYMKNISDDELELSCGIYGTLLNRKALCEGYAKTYKYLLDAVGINCIYVTGTAQNEGHAWNIVELDNSFYAVDVTWCDPQMRGGTKSYAYCMIDDKTMSKNHTVEMDYKVPSCNGGRYNYYKYNGYELAAYDVKALQEMFYRAYSSGLQFVEFHCASTTVLESFKMAVDSGQAFECFDKIESARGMRFSSFNYSLMEDVGSVRVYFR